MPRVERRWNVSSGEQRFGVHAGQMETAMMLALKPDRVRMTEAWNFESTSAERARATKSWAKGVERNWHGWRKTSTPLAPR